MSKLVKKYIVALFCGIILLYPSFIFSASFLEVVAKQQVLTAQDRGIVTLPFTVTNHGKNTLYLAENLSLPKGWRLLTSGGTFSLKAGEQVVRLVHLLASSDISVGHYTIPYRVTSKNNTSILIEEKITVIIKSRSQLVVDIVNAPSLVLAGETYTVDVRVTNKGNSSVALDVAMKDLQRYTSSFKPNKLSLKPSQSALINIQATIPNKLDNSSYHKLKLSFHGASISSEKTINTQVIARIPNGLGKYHTLPTETMLSYHHNKNYSSLQKEFKATGKLDEAGEHSIDLLVRDTKNTNDSNFVLSAERRLSYKNTEFDLHLGGHSFALKGITSTGFYGEGAEINYHPSQQRWNIRTFKAQHKKTENHSDDTETSGVELSYQFDDNLELAANILLKKDTHRYQEKTLGLSAKWDASDNIDIEASYAKDKDGSAYKIHQNAYLDSLNYSLELQRASPFFDGKIKDTQSERATGIYSFNDDKNYIRSSLYHNKRNLNKDIKQQIYEEKKVTFGVGYYFDNNNKESLYAELFKHDKKDKRLVSTLNTIEQGLRIEYKKSINNQWALNSHLEYRTVDNQTSLSQSTQRQESITLAYTPNEKYRMALNIDAGQLSKQKKKKNTLSYGANASAQFTPQQKISGYWRHSEQKNTKNDSFQINYTYLFHKGSSINLSVSKENNSSKKTDIHYSLGISIPLDIPLYKLKNISSVEGRVIDSKTQQAIANAIVNIAGQYAVSDKLGNYKFKSIKAGSYNVNTDLSKTTQENYRVVNKLEQNINLISKQVTHHNISLSLGSELNGNVLKYIASNSSIFGSSDEKLSPSGGIEGLLVTLTSTDDSRTVHKVLTLEQGYFSFKGIKEGLWQVQVSDPSKLIKSFHIDSPTKLLHIKHGEVQKVIFKAIPFIQSIKKIGPSNGFSVSSE